MSTENQTPSVSFEDFPLLPQVQQAIKNIGYETPSPIQAQAIPHLLDGKDILGIAQTGTGKTAAFALPLLSRMDIASKKTQMLVLAPTRELAIQVAEAFQSYAKQLKGFHVLPIYGGQDYRTQLRQLNRGVQVVVGTPGRVMDHLRRGSLDLSALKALVLDEADEMLRMGFIDDVEWILQQIPNAHQTALFSATMPKQIQHIAKNYLNEPVEVRIKVKTTTADTITQYYWQTKGSEKLETLTRILDVETFDGMIIFVRTKNATLEVAEKLQARGYAAEALNGDINQNQREKTVNRLKKGNLDILVATDVAARGLDVDRISHVVNYDIPYDTEAYVHRIGRTGRAGRQGQAILFITGREKRMLGQIERATKQTISKYRFPSTEELNQNRKEQFFTRLTDEMSRDVSEYQTVVEEYLQINEDVSPVQLAAVLASMTQDGKPFFLKDVPRPQVHKRERRDHDDHRNREDRDARRKRRREGDDGAAERENMAMEKFRLEVGAMHGISKGDIVGAIANEAGIESRYMGKIYIEEDHSFIDLPEGMPKELFKHLKKVSLRGQRLQISKAEAVELDDFAPRPPRRRKPGSKPSDKKSRDKRSSGKPPSSGGDRKPRKRKASPEK